MNSKKILIGLISLLGIAGLGIAGWFVWDNYQGNGSNLNNLLSSRQVDFNESYSILVNGFIDDYINVTNKIHSFSNVKEDLQLIATGNVNQSTGRLSLNMSGLYTNSGTLSENKGLLDFVYDGNIDLPPLLTNEADKLSFSGNFSLLMTEGKIFTILKSFGLNSANPQIMQLYGLVNSNLNKWILLLDYLGSGQEIGIDSALNTQDTYAFIGTIFNGLKKHQLISQSGDAIQEGDYKVYRTQLNKENVLNFYRELISTKLVTSMSGISDQELQNSVSELSGALVNANLGGTMRVKDSNNIIFEMDTVSLGEYSMSGKVLKENDRYLASFVFTPQSNLTENIIINIEKTNTLNIRGEYFSEGKKLGAINLGFNGNISNDYVDLNWNINGNVDEMNFNATINERLNAINEIASGTFLAPQNYTRLENILPSF